MCPSFRGARYTEGRLFESIDAVQPKLILEQTARKATSCQRCHAKAIIVEFKSPDGTGGSETTWP
jgi:hypothetical protein